MTESEMQVLIAADYGTRYYAIPNISFSWQGSTFCLSNEQLKYYGRNERNFWSREHEADLLLVAEKWYTEVEIKISYQDFMADFKKRGSHLTRYTKYVYYAVPEELYSSKKQEILDKLNEAFPEAGIMTVTQERLYGGRHTCVVKRPKALKPEAMSADTLMTLLWTGCQKWWRREKGNA